MAQDACKWLGALADVGPSVEAFVKAMAAQSPTASTPPVKVMVGDYSGFEFDHYVEGSVDFNACNNGKLCIHSTSNIGCSSWYLTQNEHETYRVFDLEGRRAVDESINPELMREARAVFDSVLFGSYKTS